MGSELDHLFICTSIGAPEAARLVAFGVTEGAPNVHQGQGTACRRFFFCNAYLELLWVNDPGAAQSEQVHRTHLWDRWCGRGGGNCPFGLCFRPSADQRGHMPFSTWEYRPPYLPKPLSIAVATNTDMVQEPFLCYLSFGRRADSYPIGRRQPLEHPSGLREITRAEFVSPRAHGVSPELQAVVNAKLVRMDTGAEYLLVLGFDGELRGKKIDFRPALPLIFCW